MIPGSVSPIGRVEKPPTIDNCTNIAIVRLIAVGAYGGTPGRNALRPYRESLNPSATDCIVLTFSTRPIVRVVPLATGILLSGKGEQDYRKDRGCKWQKGRSNFAAGTALGKIRLTLHCENYS